MRFKDKVAIVTGGANGIGRAVATRFAKEGANVVIADIDVPKGKETAEQLSKIGKVIFVETDITKIAEIDNMVKKTVETFGKINILINNAGKMHFVKFLKLAEQDWDRVNDVNIKGLFFCSQRVIPEIIKQGGGKVVNIASIDGLIGAEYAASYSASKGAVVNLTRQMAMEFARKKINVNAIAPGATVPTGMTGLFTEDAAFGQTILKEIPLGRWGKPEEIASAVAFLASDEADYITGQILVVDGGWTVH